MIILLHNCLAPMFAAVKSGRRHSTQVISKKQTVARPRSLEFIGFNLNSPTSLPIEFVLTSHFGKLSRNKWLSYLAGKSQTVHRSFYLFFYILFSIYFLGMKSLRPLPVHFSQLFFSVFRVQHVPRGPLRQCFMQNITRRQ